ncbi:MAG TPA: hypothetical protein PKC43_04670 [Phycisphaerales bacterium]|nr:hypothetical protein [Phycisphaerales bacterium]HMP36721.1 hypothetical protein [Phycisphaerales bacterium]
MANRTPESSPSSVPVRDPLPRAARRGPLRLLLDLFSSVKLGIALLAILFVYSSVGSAGIVYPIHPNIFSGDAWVHAQIRTWRPFEMTEFEWFHWWPFNLLIALICVNLSVTTVRRIRFNVVNLGVWMIHTGIIVLAIGSVIYFWKKVEGDVPIVRRQIVAEVDTPDGPVRTALLAMPGARTSLVAGGGRWEFEVTEIDPRWEIRSGDDAGALAYSVNVLVTAPGGRYIRQLLAGYPEYTEDILFTDDPHQPLQRAVRALGRPTVDETLRLSLAFDPADHFYLKNDAMKSWALYVRRPGDHAWVERPIHGLPLYNDYVASRDDVITAPFEPEPPAAPLGIRVGAANPEDPFPETTFVVDGFLRYAMTRTQLRRGTPADPINPAVFLTIGLRDGTDRGRQAEFRLLADDPEQSRANEGLLVFRRIGSVEERERLLLPPTLEIDVPDPAGGRGVSLSVPITRLSIADGEMPFEPIEGTPYRYRPRLVEDDIPLAATRASLAIVEIEGPGGPFRRWVFDDPKLTRDVTEETAADAHGAGRIVDAGIVMRYRPGAGRAVLTVLAGPGEDELGLIVASSTRPARYLPLTVGVPEPIGNDLAVVATDYMPRAVVVTRPFVVPRRERIRDAGEFFSQIRLGVEGGELGFADGVPWIAFHRYPFTGPEWALRRFPYSPTTVTLPGGERAEVLFSRQRRPLPAPIVLEDFRLATHVGGFTGETGSIRNYTSLVRFDDVERDGVRTLSDPIEVSVNDPIERDGWWFFQAQWDPPDEARAAGQRASAGLNYTVLGVGNREGVYIQLLGCAIAVVGMIYAFYIKPIIKRRRQEAVLAALAASTAGAGRGRGRGASAEGVRSEDELVSSGGERR